jgi:Peptidase family M13
MTYLAALFIVWLSASSSFLFSESDSLHGIDLSDLNRKAEPCSDFYEFANGTWRANNPIPASMTRWSKRWAAGESSKDKLREILKAASSNKNAPKGSTEQIIGDYRSTWRRSRKCPVRAMQCRHSFDFAQGKLSRLSRASRPRRRRPQEVQRDYQRSHYRRKSILPFSAAAPLPYSLA